jgi:hypothetical protein
MFDTGIQAGAAAGSGDTEATGLGRQQSPEPTGLRIGVVHPLRPHNPAGDFRAIDKSISENQRQPKSVEDICTWSQAIYSDAGKVIDGVDRMQKPLDAERESLPVQVEQL